MASLSTQIVNATISRYIDDAWSNIAKKHAFLSRLIGDVPTPTAEPKPVYIPPPRNDFPELRRRISELELEVDEYREQNRDDEDWCERDSTDAERELFRLDCELSRLESLADNVGGLSPAVRRIEASP